MNTKLLYSLIDTFVSEHPETELAKEWRELSADKAVSKFQYAESLRQLEPAVPEEIKGDLAHIKLLLSIA